MSDWADVRAVETLEYLALCEDHRCRAEYLAIVLRVVEGQGRLSAYGGLLHKIESST